MKPKQPTQSAEDVVYANCTFTEGYDTPPLTSVLHLKVRVQSLSLGNVEYPFITIILRSTLTWSGSTR